MTRKYLEDVARPAIERGLASRGRPRSRFAVCGGGFVATGPDEESASRMRDTIRYRVAFYASTTSYWPVLEAHGWKALGEKLRAMTLKGQWKDMAKEVPDDVLSEFCVTAPFRDLGSALAKRFGGIVDLVELAPPDGTPEGALRELAEDIHRLPTPLTAACSTWEEIAGGEVDAARAHATPNL
jgi:hypothetical protein